MYGDLYWFSCSVVALVLGAVGITAFVSGICCIAACRSHRIYLRRNGLSLRRLPQNSLGMAEKRSGNVKPLLESEDEDFA